MLGYTPLKAELTHVDTLVALQVLKSDGATMLDSFPKAFTTVNLCSDHGINTEAKHLNLKFRFTAIKLT